jgi:PKD repeat protein
MNVTVNGIHTSSIRGDTEWHFVYVPTDDPIPDPTPVNEPKWFEGRYWPHFPTTDRVYVTYVSCEIEDIWGSPSKSDWRINGSYSTMMALTLVGMQGVINRYTPEVFLDWADSLHMQDRGWQRSKFWLTQVAQHAEVIQLGLNSSDALNFFYQRYSSYFNGAVIYDPTVPDTINLATMLAGLENRIILAPEQIGLESIPYFEDIVDLRVLVEQQGWDASEEGAYKLYKWVYENLWPSLEKRMIGVMSPGPPTSRTLPDQADVYYPLGLAARDYMVALKLPVLYLDPREDPQASLLSNFFEEASFLGIISGFFAADEPGLVDLASTYGHIVPAVTNTNGPFGNPDLTVLSALRPEIIKYDSKIDLDRIFSTLGDDPVITSWCSDGDAIMMLTDLGWRWEQYWDEYPDLSYSVSINPTVIDLAPVIWNYYTQENSARVRGLVTGVSGAGYITPHYMSDEQLSAYLERTKWYMNQTGLRTVWRWRPWIDDIGYERLITDFDLKYYESLKDVGYLGMLVGYGSDGRYGSGFLYNGAPTPAVPPAYFLDGSTNRSWIINDILSRRPDEVFIELATYDQVPTEIVEDDDAYGGRAAHFFSSDEKWDPAVFGPGCILTPGTYEATFSMKITDNQPRYGEFCTIMVVESPGIDWSVLGERNLQPTDFNQADEYQNFTLEFTLDHFAVSVEFILSYHPPPSGDPASFPHIYADYIRCKRDGDTGLPKFSAVLTSGWWEPWAKQLGKEFSEAGGVVLHTDEYMAALNPEYMVNWATKVLGEDNPELQYARQLLEERDFLSSLIAVRSALMELPNRTYIVKIPGEDEQFVTIHGNTLVTPFEYIANEYTIDFRTHGPPKGTVSLLITIPNELQDGETMFTVDNKMIDIHYVMNNTHTVYDFVITQGPHTVNVILPLNRPPLAAFEYLPEEPTVLDSVIFRDLSFDVENQIVSYTWSFGDESTSTEAEPVHRYNEKGTYVVTLTIADDGGLMDTASQTINVSNLPPTAGFMVSTNSPRVGETVEFRDQSTDPEEKPLWHSWDFGDGSSSMQNNPIHEYSTSGEFVVYLTVTDDEGMVHTTTRIINVVDLAEFEVSNLSIKPELVMVGEPIMFSATCVNIGGSQGSYTIALKVDGEAIDEKTVNLESGESKTVSFEIVSVNEGTYSVDVNGLKGTFTVEEPSDGKIIPGFKFSSVVLGVAIGILILWFLQSNRNV